MTNHVEKSLLIKKGGEMLQNFHFWRLFLCFLLATQSVSATNKPDIFPTQTAVPHAWILDKRVATPISTRRIYADSSWDKETNQEFQEGELVEILNETRRTYQDHSQRQKYKWYLVRNMAGQEGWIYGNELAIAVPDEAVTMKVRPFLKKITNLNSGFEQAMLWVANVEGKENSQKQDFLNPIYRESYLVITNNLGRCATILMGKNELEGKLELQKFALTDVNSNGTPEIVVETSTLSKSSAIENRKIEIFGFQTAMLTTLFEHDLTLTFDSDLPSPALSKHVEIEGSKIRIAYVDFVRPDRYSLKLPTDWKGSVMERCLEYVTFSLQWNERTKSFDTLYAPTHSAPYAYAYAPAMLKNIPPPVYAAKNGNAPAEQNVVTITPEDRLQIIKQVEIYIVDDEGNKRLKNYLFVKHPSGMTGYISAESVQIRNIEHAPLLNRYYEKTPLNKADWKDATAMFVNVK
jgi:hypothetical protein